MLLYLYLFAEYKCTGSQSSIREIDNKLITELFKAIFLLKNIHRYNFDTHESYFNSEDLQIMCATKKIEKLNPKDPKIIYAQINDLLREVCEMNNRYTSSVGKKTLISNIKQFCDAIYEYEMLLKEFNQLLQNKIVFPALKCKERSPYFCFLEKIGFKNNPIDMFDLETKQQMNLKIKEIQEHLAHIKELREELKYTDNLCDKIEELINKNNLEKKAVVKDRTLKYLKDILQNKKDIDSFYEIEINNRMGESVFSKIKFFTSLQKIVTLDGNIADDLLQISNRDELPILQEGRDLKLNLLLSILVLKMLGSLNELQLRTIIKDLIERAKTEIKNNQSEVAKIKTEINDLLLYLNQGSLFEQEVKFKSEPAFLKSLQELETKIIKPFKSELQYVLDHGYLIGNLITFIKLAVKQVMPREAEFIDKDLKKLRNREFLLLRDAMFKISLPPEITDLVNIDNIQLSKKNIFRMLLRIH